MNNPIRLFLAALLSASVWFSAYAESMPSETQSAESHVDTLAINPALKLQDVLARTLLRNPSQAALQARASMVKAKSISAKSLLPQAPAVTVGHQNDSFASNRGEREWQAELELPIWLPNQRHQRYQVAEATQANFNAHQESLKLTAAGMLREAIWDVTYNDNAALLATQQLQLAQALTLDVEKRFKAGELAKSDVFLSQQETLKVEREKLRAEAELMHARYRYQLITGLHEMPAAIEEQQSAITDYAQSPIWLEAMSKVDLAESALHLAEVESRDNPQILLNMRRIQGGFDYTYNDSLGVKIRIPFGSEVKSAPIKAMAAYEVGSAQSERDAMRFKLEQAMHEAEHNLAVTQAELNLATQHFALAKQSLQLTQKAFQLGETDLVNLLRAQAQTFESERMYASRQIQLKWDVARYNQAVGVLP